MTDRHTVDVLANAARELTITRRADKDRWVHLSLCVLDAVFSIGARYAGVVRVCRTYAGHARLDVATLPHRDAGAVIGAALRYAERLVGHDVQVLADPDRLARVEEDLRGVPGNGVADVRFGDLWMLAGDDEQVKPDRMVLRWPARALGWRVDPGRAAELIAATARLIGCTPWELDHAVWRTGSGRNP